MTTSLSRLAATDHRFTRKTNDLRVRVLELDDAGEQGHLLVFGDIADGCLVRIHSRCLYGEVLRSDDCDCGPELVVALDLIQAAGSGVLVYLEQEGRGLGLIAKARGYRHSEQHGTDSFTSYHQLGFPVDARTYDATARSLVALGLSSITLLTNNPAKVEALETAGITVVAEPLLTAARSQRARAYLEAKRVLRGHAIPEAGIALLAMPNAVGRTARMRAQLPLPSRESVAMAVIVILSVLLVMVGHIETAAAAALLGLLGAAVYAVRNRGLLVELKARQSLVRDNRPGALSLESIRALAPAPEPPPMPTAEDQTRCRTAGLGPGYYR